MIETRIVGMIGASLWQDQRLASIDVQMTLFTRMNAEAEIDPAPELPDELQQEWWNTSYGRWRLEVEERAMRERFPDFVSVLLEEKALAWMGWLQSGLPGGERYLVHVIYGPAFPDVPPDVIIKAPEFPQDTPHLLYEREPCLFNNAGRAWGYDPASTTAATLVAWTALWIHAYETWRQTGSWPGRGA